MFDIEYLITPDFLEEISNISSDEFDKEFYDIYGQIKLNFGSEEYGLCDAEYRYSTDLLMLWFNLLNSVVINLRTSNYVAMNVPETSFSYFVFRKTNDILIIGLERSKDKSIRGFLIKEPLRDVYSYAWSGIRVNLKDFEDRIIGITKEFINEVNLINPDLLESNTFKRFISNCSFV